ncbi:hypothetical protein ABG067_008457, partial [Albugo candida]
MPKVSNRHQTIKNINSLLRQSVIDEEDREAEELDEILWGIETKRCLNSGDGIPKLKQFRDYFLQWSDEEFVKICRMERETFIKILRLIENNNVFLNESYCPQLDVHVQLAVTLKRLSHDGTGNSLDQLAAYFGISK